MQSLIEIWDVGCYFQIFLVDLSWDAPCWKHPNLPIFAIFIFWPILSFQKVFLGHFSCSLRKVDLKTCCRRNNGSSVKGRVPPFWHKTVLRRGTLPQSIPAVDFPIFMPCHEKSLTEVELCCQQLRWKWDSSLFFLTILLVDLTTFFPYISYLPFFLSKATYFVLWKIIWMIYNQF